MLKGTVDIDNDGVIISKCREGEAFGEMSVLNHRPHCASAEAATDVKLFTMNEAQIEELLTKPVASRFLLNIVHLLSAHIEKANAVIAQQCRTEQMNAVTPAETTSLRS